MKIFYLVISIMVLILVNNFFLQADSAEIQVDTFANDACWNPTSEISSEVDFVKTVDDNNLLNVYRGDLAKLYNENEETLSIEFALFIEPDKYSFTEGESFQLLLDMQTASDPINADIYFVLLDPDFKLYFGLDWSTTPKLLLSDFPIPADLSITKSFIVEIIIPGIIPPVSTLGTYTFAIGAAEPGTLNFVSNIGFVSFNVQ